MRRIVLALSVLALAPLAAEDRPLPDYDAFAARVKAHLAADEDWQSGYMFTERRTEQKLDGAGRVKGESVKVFEVYPGLPGEDRYRRLIAEDGKPVPGDAVARQDCERQKKVETYSRTVGTTHEQQKRQREREKALQRNRAAIDDLFRIYDIRMVQREDIEGHTTIRATLTPNARVKPQTDEGNAMRHFKAQAWISESDYELVRVDVEAIDDLAMGWGLLARVHKGTVATYQRRKVNAEAWLPAQVTWTASARVLLLRSMRLRGVSEYSGYRKFTVDTSATYLTPPP